MVGLQGIYPVIPVSLPGTVVRGALIQETVWFGDIPIATLRPHGSGGVNVFYVHTDHLGTPRRVSRPSDNAIVWRWDSDPFGTTSASGDPDGDSNLFVYNLKFPGQYYDPETGLHYNYFRDYDPSTGRYIQSDPLGINGGTNLYVYANSNAVLIFDPYGLYCLTIQEINGIAGAIGGAFAGGTALAAAGPVAIAAGAFLGGVFGGGLGYFGTGVSEGQAMIIGGASGAATGIRNPGASVTGGVVGAAVGSQLEASGIPSNIAGPLAGAVGGFAGNFSAVMVSNHGAKSMKKSLLAALRSGRLGGLSGLSGAALAAAVAELLKAGNECSDCEK